MQRRAADRQGMGDLKVGTIVHMRVEDVDRAKIDNVNATLVVLDRTEHGNYVVGNKAGIYKEKVSRPYLTPVKHATPRMMALDQLLEEYQDEGRRAKLRWVSVRRVAAAGSAAGGQGMLHCSCRGECNTNRCSCFKAGRACTSRCHHHNTRCINHD